MRRAPVRVLPALLLIVVAVAGWRTIATMRVVLRGGAPQGPSAESQALAAEEARERALLDRARRGDSLLAALGTRGVAADPFRPRAEPGADQQRARRRVEAVQTPALILCAVDAARPEVILRLGDRESGRLAQGQAWEGWTVVRIDRTGVELSGFGQGVFLPAPNQGR